MWHMNTNQNALCMLYIHKPNRNPSCAQVGLQNTIHNQLIKHNHLTQIALCIYRAQNKTVMQI